MVDTIRAGLAAAADPGRAPGMQRYMKSEMPYRGVPTPVWRALVTRAVAAHPLTSDAVLAAAVRELWHGATHREERYAALQLLADRRHARWLTPDRVPLLRELIVDGAWWDHVDLIATRLVGRVLRDHRAQVTPTVREWIVDADVWLRRTAIICQVGAKSATDPALLTDAIEANVAERDFFVRKGIGWALRDYSKTEPGWVRRFLDTHPDLSPLSRREGGKYC